MAQVPADVQADQVFKDILGAVNNPRQVNIKAADAPAINQPAPAAPAVAQNPV